MYQEDDFAHKFGGGEKLYPKLLYKRITGQKLLSSQEICTLLCNRHDVAMKRFAEDISVFLCR
jgi:hypothetical protein